MLVVNVSEQVEAGEEIVFRNTLFYVAPDWGRANGIAKGKGILVLKHRN